MSRLSSALSACSALNPVDCPFAVVSFANLRPWHNGARLVAANNWIGGIQDDINAQQSLGNPGCVLHFEDGAYYIIQSW